MPGASDTRRWVRAVVGTLVAVLLATQILLAGTSAYAATPEDGYSDIAEVPADAQVDELVEGQDYVPGEVIVGFDGSVDDPASQAALEDAVTVSSDADVLTTAGDDGSAARISDTAAVVEVEDGATVAQAVTELSQSDEVAYVQPNFIYTMTDDAESADAAASDGLATSADSVTVNDPDVSRQWYLDDIGVRQAWGISKGADGGVCVAVVDTGCDVGHPDLAGNVVATYNAVDQTTDVTDTVGHGTGVCGVISAVANNGAGIAGVSYNAKILPIKASTTGNRFNSASVSNALEYAVAMKDTYGIRVVNMSLSAVSTNRTADMEKAIYAAVDDAYAAGMLVVCAAGNAEVGTSLPYASVPGDYSKCLSVMNVNEDHALNSSSNYNVAGTRAKDLCAPGSTIYTCLDGARSEPLNHTTSGTSYAAPMVSAVAALCFAANPLLTPKECADVLEQTATDLGDAGWDERYGYGEVNALAALRVQVLRLYNPYSGEHLYTTSQSEYDYLGSIGWNKEGTAWYASRWKGQAILRLYNPYSGDHLYTASRSEYDRLARLGWRQEGTAFYANPDGSGSGLRVLRLFNPYETVGTHLYTTSEGEYQQLSSIGWRGEGTAWYALEE